MSVPRLRAVFWLAAAAMATLTAGAGASATAPGSASVEPVRPGSLALGPGGVLYIADDARHQILAMTPVGRFRIVAGTGEAGFSGDGEQARRAELGDPAGMVVRGDGTLLFADESTNRIRAIAPDGRIRTIAGDGRFGSAQSGASALTAHLGSPAALTVGSHGLLYVALAGGNEIVRIDRDGTLTRIAGNKRYQGLVGIGHRAVDASPSGPNGLAFDRRGDLFIAGFNTKTLLEIDHAGIMRRPLPSGGFYPRGDGGIVPAPAGAVLAIDTQRVVELSPRGERTVFDLAARRIAGTHTFLPNGIAAGPDGSIYVDTYLGNGWTTQSVIAVIRPDRSVGVLWRATR